MPSQDQSGSISALPTVNFVWIGPPKFDAGGIDVRGVESIDENFKLHSVENRNPMVFWCQREHERSYREYFSSKGILIDVQSVDDYLDQQASTGDKKAVFVHEAYRTLTSPARNKILDFVNFKDLFFLFLLARQGNQYVLDTNIKVLDPAKKITLASCETHCLPWLSDYSSDYSFYEVWMMYAPEDNQYAKRQFKCYQYSYQTFVQWLADHPDDLYSDMHRREIGGMATSAAVHTLRGTESEFQGRSALPDESRISRIYSQYSNTPLDYWFTRTIMAGYNVTIPELNLMKEHGNTHHAKQLYPSHIYRHIAHGQLDEVRGDLDHGISVDLTTTGVMPYLESRTIRNQNLLSTAIRWFNICKFHRIFMEDIHDDIRANQQKYLDEYAQIVKLLLDRGANPNEIYYSTESTGQAQGLGQFGVFQTLENPRNAIYDIISFNSVDLMRILIEHSQCPLDLTLGFYGKNLLQHAQERNDDEIIELLEVYMQNKNPPFRPH